MLGSIEGAKCKVCGEAATKNDSTYGKDMWHRMVACCGHEPFWVCPKCVNDRK